MTKVENVSIQMTQNKHRAPRHLANAAITAGGLTGTLYLTKQAAKHSTRVVIDGTKIATSGASANKIGKSFKEINIVETPIGKFFSKMGEIIFNPNNKLYGNSVKRVEKYLISNKLITKPLPAVKRGAAILLTAAIVGLGFIANGIYQAGKINAD